MEDNPRSTSRFRKSLESMDDIFAFIDSYFAKKGVGDDDAFAIRLAVDEIFANMVKHNSPGQGIVDVRLACRDGSCQVELVDFDVEKFDIGRPNEEDMTRAADTHQTGGRGIYLIRQMMDELSYDYIDGNSHVRLVKKLG